jgi:hypothetical protein
MIKIVIVGPQLDKWINPKYTSLQIENIVKGNIYSIFRSHATKTKREYSEYCIEYEYDYSDIILISGHCPYGGVDIWAEEIADELGIEKEIYAPDINQWEDKHRTIVGYNHIYDKVVETEYEEDLMGYKSRNKLMADKGNIVYCIVPDRHELTCKHCKIMGHPSNGGCYTLNYAKKLGKETHLVIIK